MFQILVPILKINLNSDLLLTNHRTELAVNWWLIGGLVHFIFKICIMVPTLVPISHVKWVPPEWVPAQQDGPTSGYPPNTHLNLGHLVGLEP
jgi:hypothetical protein